MIPHTNGMSNTKIIDHRMSELIRDNQRRLAYEAVYKDYRSKGLSDANAKILIDKHYSKVSRIIGWDGCWLTKDGKKSMRFE